MTIQLDSIVCIKNTNTIDSESYETCEVGKVLYLYEDNSNAKPLTRAVVQWYSRYVDNKRYSAQYKTLKLFYFRQANLKSVVSKECLNSLDPKYEVVEDSRFSGDIQIDSIFDVGKMFKCKEECEKAKKPQGRFFCQYKLEKISKTRFTLAALRGLSLTLKRVNDDKFDLTKSPHGKWVVKMVRIAEDIEGLVLNSIENIEGTPKRKSAAGIQTQKTPSANTEEERNKFRKKIFDDDESSEEETCTPKKQSRRSMLKLAGSATPSTPKAKGIASRRKSILKTPTVSKANTPRRSIQFVETVEEYKYKKSSLIAPEEQPIEDESVIATVRKRLHVSAVPKSLPCREKEFREIYSFLEANLTDEIGGCMYVSGVPGTGKTATTTEVIRALKAEVEKENLPEFQFIEINAMRLTEPRQAYVEICRQLMGKTMTWEQAFYFLDKRFSTPSHRRISTILVVDELDILCNKRQDVVYNLLNWPHQNSARLTVVTIANTMDLPERVFMGKIGSRVGFTRLTFQPYTHKQLQEIVASRLTGLDSSFSSDAIQLVARKVAALSGDARRALDICRRASEIAEGSAGDQKASVTMTHVQEALGEMISCTKVRIIKSCSKMEKFFLQAVCMEVDRTGIDEVIFRGVYNQLKILATLHGSLVPTVDTALKISVRLGACRLLISEHPRKDIYQKILLNVSSDDVYYATELRNRE